MTDDNAPVRTSGGTWRTMSDPERPVRGGWAMTAPSIPLYRCCRHCRDWPGGCPDGGHVVPCVVGCELGAQPIRPLIWTTSGLRMVAE